MMLSALSMSLCVLGIRVLPTLTQVFVFYGIFGLSLSLLWPPLMGWLSFGIEGGELGRAMGRQTLASNIGMIISPLITGLLSERSPVYPLYAAAALFLATLLLVGGASLALPRIRNDTDQESSLNAAGGDDRDRSTPLRFPAWVGLFASYVILGVVLFIFPVYARSELGFSKSSIGTLLLLRGLITAISFVLLGRFSFWQFRRFPMIIGSGFLVVLLLALMLARNTLTLGVPLALLGIPIAMGFSASYFHGASGSTRRARRMATHETLLAAGLIFGSALGGQLYQQFSMRIVLLACSLLVLLALGVQVLLFQLLNPAVKDYPDHRVTGEEDTYDSKNC
jgi:MFS family permease